MALLSKRLVPRMVNGMTDEQDWPALLNDVNQILEG